MEFRFTGEQLASFVPSHGFDLVAFDAGRGAGRELFLLAHFDALGAAEEAMMAASASGVACFVSGPQRALQLDLFGAPFAGRCAEHRPFRRTYRLRWRTWDDDVDAGARDFERAFGVSPNALLASSSTLARIDMAAARGRLVNDAGERAAEGEAVTVGSFVGAGYELRFAIDDSVRDDHVALALDGDPDGGGEPMPEYHAPVGRLAPRPYRLAG